MAARDTVQVNFRLDSDAKAWLEKKAKNDERSQGWLITKALKEEMRKDEQIRQA
ncbi:hypothetical protein D3C75_999100 [compost metagenome]